MWAEDEDACAGEPWRTQGYACWARSAGELRLSEGDVSLRGATGATLRAAPPKPKGASASVEGPHLSHPPTGWHALQQLQSCGASTLPARPAQSKCPGVGASQRIHGLCAPGGKSADEAPPAAPDPASGGSAPAVGVAGVALAEKGA